MIWQLIRRDPAWRRMPWVTLTVAVFCALWHFFAPADREGIPTLFLFEVLFGILITGLIAVFAQTADTAFQGTLPVTVRQVFLSRMFSSAAMMALPVTVGFAILIALHDPVASEAPAGVWASFTCTVLGIQCLLIRRRAVPPWLVILLLPPWIFIVGVAGVSGLLQGGYAYAIAARIVCWAIVAAVVLRTWWILPPSFQDAPMKMPAAPPERRATAGRNPGALSWKTWFHIAGLSSGWVFVPMFVVVLMGASNPFLLILLGLQ